jgi:hypothetical protein
MDTLAFGCILPTTGRIPDFHRLETCAARRTINETGSIYNPVSFPLVQFLFHIIINIADMRCKEFIQAVLSVVSANA